MVAGVSNKVHSVTPGEGGSLSCDNNCENRSTKICEHTLAVAQLNGTLQEFITWYKRSKRGPNITNMAAAGGPKSAERKPSKRKRSNAKTQPVLQQIDLLQHNSDELPPEGSGNSEAMGSQFNISAPSVPLQSSSQYSVPSVPLQSSSQYNVPTVPLQSSTQYSVPSVPLQSSSQYNIPSVPLQTSSQYTRYHISTANHLPIQDGAFLRQVEATPNHIRTQQIGTPTHPYTTQSALLSIPHAPPTTNGSSFTLK